MHCRQLMARLRKRSHRDRTGRSPPDRLSANINQLMHHSLKWVIVSAARLLLLPSPLRLLCGHGL